MALPCAVSLPPIRLPLLQIVGTLRKTSLRNALGYVRYLLAHDGPVTDVSALAMATSYKSADILGDSRNGEIC